MTKGKSPKQQREVPEATKPAPRRVYVRNAKAIGESFMKQLHHWRGVTSSADGESLFIVTRLEIHRALVAMQRRRTIGGKEPLVLPGPKPLAQFKHEAAITSLLLRLTAQTLPRDSVIKLSGSSRAVPWPCKPEEAAPIFFRAPGERKRERDHDWWRQEVQILVRDATLELMQRLPSNKPAYEAARRHAAELLALVRSAIAVSARRKGLEGEALLPPDKLLPGSVELIRPPPSAVQRPVYLCLVTETDIAGRFEAEVLGNRLVGGHRGVRHAIGALTGHSLEKARHFKPWKGQARAPKPGDRPPIYIPTPEMELTRRTCVVLPRRWLEIAANTQGDAESVRTSLSHALDALLKVRRGPDERRAVVVVTELRSDPEQPDQVRSSDPMAGELEEIATEVAAIFARREFEESIPGGRGRRERLRHWRKLFAWTCDPQDWMLDHGERAAWTPRRKKRSEALLRSEVWRHGF